MNFYLNWAKEVNLCSSTQLIKVRVICEQEKIIYKNLEML